MGSISSCAAQAEKKKLSKLIKKILPMKNRGNSRRNKHRLQWIVFYKYSLNNKWPSHTGNMRGFCEETDCLVVWLSCSSRMCAVPYFTESRSCLNKYDRILWSRVMHDTYNKGCGTDCTRSVFFLKHRYAHRIVTYAGLI